MKILLALLEIKQAYRFQLTLMTGAARQTVVTALDILFKNGMIHTVKVERAKKNTKDFYELTAHGHHVANHLKEVAKSLENDKEKDKPSHPSK